jgi:hypothetical protein
MTPIFTYWLDAVRLSWDAQHVIALRMTSAVARSDAGTRGEAVLMVTEKMAALGEAQITMVSALASGCSAEVALRRALVPYRRRVRANRRRLLR